MFKPIFLALIFFFTNAFPAEKPDELYLNYAAAVKNGSSLSTFQMYLVVRVKNLRTGEEREYCTEGSGLSGAIHTEYHLGYSQLACKKADEIALSHKDRYFEFKNADAIKNISQDYTMAELKQLESKVNFDSLAHQMKSTGEGFVKSFSDKEIAMYAHALFNRGVLTGVNNCFTDGLHYVKRNDNVFK